MFQSVGSKSIYGVFMVRSMEVSNTLTFTYGAPDNFIVSFRTSTSRSGCVVTLAYEFVF